MKVDDLRISIKGLGHEESDKEGHYGQNINNVHPVLDNDNDNDQDTMMLIMICRKVSDCEHNPRWLYIFFWVEALLCAFSVSHVNVTKYSFTFSNFHFHTLKL